MRVVIYILWIARWIWLFWIAYGLHSWLRWLVAVTDFGCCRLRLRSHLRYGWILRSPHTARLVTRLRIGWLLRLFLLLPFPVGCLRSHICTVGYVTLVILRYCLRFGYGCVTRLCCRCRVGSRLRSVGYIHLGLPVVTLRVLRVAVGSRGYGYRLFCYRLRYVGSHYRVYGSHGYAFTRFVHRTVLYTHTAHTLPLRLLHTTVQFPVELPVYTVPHFTGCCPVTAPVTHTHTYHRLRITVVADSAVRYHAGCYTRSTGSTVVTVVTTRGYTVTLRLRLPFTGYGLHTRYTVHVLRSRFGWLLPLYTGYVCRYVYVLWLHVRLRLVVVVALHGSSLRAFVGYVYGWLLRLRLVTFTFRLFTHTVYTVGCLYVCVCYIGYVGWLRLLLPRLRLPFVAGCALRLRLHRFTVVATFPARLRVRTLLVTLYVTRTYLCGCTRGYTVTPPARLFIFRLHARWLPHVGYTFTFGSLRGFCTRLRLHGLVYLRLRGCTLHTVVVPLLRFVGWLIAYTHCGCTHRCGYHTRLPTVTLPHLPVGYTTVRLRTLRSA